MVKCISGVASGRLRAMLDCTSSLTAPKIRSCGQVFMLYDNFDVRILPANEKEKYTVEASFGPLGRATEPLGELLSDQGFVDLNQKISQGRRLPRSGSDFMLLGEKLFRALFRGNVYYLWLQAVSRTEASEERDIRVRLAIDPPELAVLPWEFLFNPERRKFLAADPSTLLVRFLDQSVFPPITPLTVWPPLKMLVVVPGGTGLDVDRERDLILDAVELLPEGTLDVRFLDGEVTLERLGDAISGEAFHILHYIGHGSFDENRQEAFLYFNGSDRGEWVATTQIGHLLLTQSTLRLVVLNACQSAEVSSARAFVGMAPALVAAGVPSVVAMQYPILDRDAVSFARNFYRALCKGDSVGRVDVATTHARNRLLAYYPGSRGFATPVIYMRAEWGTLFTLPSGGHAESKTAAEILGRNDRYRFYTLKMFENELESLRRRLEIIQGNLQTYLQRRDVMGLDTPTYILTEIKRLKDEENALQKEIRRLSALIEQKRTISN